MSISRPIPLLASLTLVLAGGARLAALDADAVQLHGFASQGWLASHDNRAFMDNSDSGGSFAFNEFAVNVTATPIQQVRIGAQLFANSFGKYGKDRVQLDWGYGEYQVATGSDRLDLSFEAGRIKTSHGLQNDFVDLDMTRTQVFLPMSIYSPTLRDLNLAVNGAGTSGTVRTDGLGAFTLFLYVGGQNLHTDGALADLLANPAFGFSGVDDMSLRRHTGASLTWRAPLDGLRLKASVFDVNHFHADTYGQGPTGKVPLPQYFDDLYNGTFGAEYQHDDLTLAAEYSNQYAKLHTDLSALGAGELTNYLRQEGAYGTASWRFAERWEGLVGYTWYDDSGAVRDPVLSFSRGVVLALRCDITSHWLVKGEFQRNRGTALLDSQHAPPTGYDEYWNLFALKTTFDF